jgi:hypothetical protein
MCTRGRRRRCSPCRCRHTPASWRLRRRTRRSGHREVSEAKTRLCKRREPFVARVHLQGRHATTQTHGRACPVQKRWTPLMRSSHVPCIQIPRCKYFRQQQERPCGCTFPHDFPPPPQSVHQQVPATHIPRLRSLSELSTDDHTLTSCGTACDARSPRPSAPSLPRPQVYRVPSEATAAMCSNPQPTAWICRRQGQSNEAEENRQQHTETPASAGTCVGVATCPSVLPFPSRLAHKPGGQFPHSWRKENRMHTPRCTRAPGQQSASRGDRSRVPTPCCDGLHANRSKRCDLSQLPSAKHC